MTVNEGSYIIRQWGRKLPNGNIDWQTEDGWTPTWSTKEGRDSERAEFARSLETLGVPSTGLELQFFQREQAITLQGFEEIID